jgi:hypothetical protein
LEHATLRSYKQKHSISKEQRSTTYDKDIEADYNAFVKKWENDVKTWLETNKYQISLEDFLKLYKKFQKDKKNKKEADEE